MAKKVGVILMGVFVIAFLGVNLFFYFKGNDPSSPISGFLIKELPMGLNMSVIAFILQWVILLFVVIFAYAKFLKHKREEDEKAEHFVIPPLESKSQTYLDVLYGLLKKEKSIGIGTIAKTFKLPKEKALEWAKILEDNELATIEYPAFADPELKVKGAELSQEEIQQNKDKKEEAKK